MILVDSSVWVDHLRSANVTMSGLLEDGLVLGHPFVTGELALGNLRQRAVVLQSLHDLPRADSVTDDELFYFIELHALAGLGIGLVDAHLLASVILTPDALLWTGDRRLRAVAQRLGRHVRFD